MTIFQIYYSQIQISTSIIPVFGTTFQSPFSRDLPLSHVYHLLELYTSNHATFNHLLKKTLNQSILNYIQYVCIVVVASVHIYRFSLIFIQIPKIIVLPWYDYCFEIRLTVNSYCKYCRNFANRQLLEQCMKLKKFSCVTKFKMFLQWFCFLYCIGQVTIFSYVKKIYLFLQCFCLLYCISQV